MAATARTEAPRTAYAFPGQGIQSKGMGMEAYARSKAARDVWERADKHTREALGFSILTVVKDNPTRLKARGVEYSHPDGVLYLTQFTQVAMATLGAAQTAELREAGAFVEGAMLCGHSVGEYNALAAVSGVIPLEAVLEVVFQRGSVMHELVPRDAKGRSNYRLAAIRPSQLGLDDDRVADFVASVAADSGEFLEIVNYNLRGSQYAIAGTVRGLDALETEVNRLRDEFGGRSAFILVPGIDVPFHSTVLRSGVPDFRDRLDELLPAHIDPDILAGRYVPNLVPKPFTLEREFVQEIADLVPSEPLNEVLADFDTWAANPGALCRTLLIELLAWQFASPVRWIETQDLLFGTAGVERFIEIGVGSAPTVANLASSTLKIPGRSGGPVEVLNFERDNAVLFAIDSDPVDDVDDAPAETSAPDTAAPAAVESLPSNGLPAAGGPRPDDIAFAASDATSILVAFGTKMRVDQIGTADSIESLCDGVSSRRNQLLVDLGTELSLGAIDGAAEADAPTLAATVNKLARTYRTFGPVLSEAINDRLRQAFGPTGRRPAAITERVTGVWQLGAGWALHVSAEVALGTREGSSVRSGALGGLGALTSGTDVDNAIDTAVAAVAARKGVQVSLPAAQGSDSMVDAAALTEITDQITGPDGALASTARHLLAELGLDDQVDVDAADNFDAEVVKLVTSELGADWPRLVAPAFDAARALLIDDRWASAREDLATIWTGGDVNASFTGTGDIVANQARWWASRVEQEGRVDLAARYGDIAEQAVDDVSGIWADEIAVVTGASAGSIAASVVGDLLAGGATVIATTSRLDQKRLGFYRDLYRTHARGGAALWVVPANLASYADVDAVIDWIGNDQIEVLGGKKQLVKPAMRPTLLFPFAAPQVMGDLTDVGARAELDMRVLLWSVERLIGGLSAVGHEADIDSTLHVVLPGSPNRGKFGGDGSYGEAKAALDAVVAKWHAERSWGSRVSLIHAMIGWVRGTGLMGHNDPLVGAVEAAGVRTWSPSEMAVELLQACSNEARTLAKEAPIELDLTGGLNDADLDLTALAALATDETPEPAQPADTIGALPPSPAALQAKPVLDWPELAVDPADLVVIVGAGELGPYGSSRTRFEMEVGEELSAAGVLELAWTTGLIAWEEQPVAGWYDAESGEHVAEEAIAERYHDRVVEACGVRTYGDDGSIVDGSVPLLTSVFLDKDLSFDVSSEAEARAFKESDPDHTVIGSASDGEWTVIRRAGTEIRVPRRMKLTRTVGGQIPTGFDPLRWGIPADMVDSLDRVALWNLICTVDAFLSSGFSPAELMRWVHPAQVANTQGTGMGGMGSMHSLYIDTLLGTGKPNDLLQEALPNVIAAHVMQSYVGGYGAMVHPVGACATAVVSVEEAVDKIRLGKASLVVAGGFDDLGAEGIMGFADMSATADSAAMSAKGIEDRYFSRANDRRRGGFVESQGGGTVLLARGDVAQEMGLPVLGVLAWAGSFGDGIHTSIP
ncbi:MAG TPA: acyltransferase domain-containing protein, partial [Aeromicrobium sp.]|nr:acyltransferase domain-containing protein [Aeromicrobium sp.]